MKWTAIILISMACTYRNDPKPSLLGNWNLQNIQVNDNIQSYTYSGGCDYSNVPTQFLFSISDMDIDFKDQENADLVFNCSNYSNPVHWKQYNTKDLEFVIYDTSYKLEVVSLDNNNLKLKFVFLPYEPVYTFKRQ